MGNILTVYYSRKGENYYGGRIENLPKGNTEAVAEMIQGAAGGDIFEIDTVKPYPADYNACTEEAQRELRANARPELKHYMDSLDGYDTIFIGYPNWWGTMPMAMFTFLERHDLRGKRIFPFCTHEGGGMGNSERDLEKACPGAIIGKGLAVRGCKAAEAQADVSAWARKAARG